MILIENFAINKNDASFFYFGLTLSCNILWNSNNWTWYWIEFFVFKQKQYFVLKYNKWKVKNKIDIKSAGVSMGHIKTQ